MQIRKRIRSVTTKTVPGVFKAKTPAKPTVKVSASTAPLTVQEALGSLKSNITNPRGHVCSRCASKNISKIAFAQVNDKHGQRSYDHLDCGYCGNRWWTYAMEETV